MDMLNMFFWGMIVETFVWWFFWWNLSLSSTPSASCFQPVPPNSIGTLLVVPLFNKRKDRWFLPVLKFCHKFHHSSRVWCFSKHLFPCRGRQYWQWHRSMCLKSQSNKTLRRFPHFWGFSLDNQITKAFGQSCRDGKDRLLNHQL